jgi:hypothetical protein
MGDVNHFVQEKSLALLLRHMKTGSPTDRLHSLLAALQHFDHSPDFGDSEAVAAIRKHLMVRIREAESALHCPDRVQLQARSTSQILRGELAKAHAEAA